MTWLHFHVVHLYVQSILRIHYVAHVSEAMSCCDAIEPHAAEVYSDEFIKTFMENRTVLLGTAQWDYTTSQCKAFSLSFPLSAHRSKDFEISKSPDFVNLPFSDCCCCCSEFL